MQTWQKAFLIVIIVLCAIAFASVILDNIQVADKTYEDGSVSFVIGEDWAQGEAEKNEWNFYKYINTVPVLNSSNTISEDDYSSFPAAINVYYNVTEIESIEKIKLDLQESLAKSEDKADVQDMSISKTTQNYDLLKVKLVYNNSPEQILYYYYILSDGKLSCITGYSFNLDDSEKIETEADKLVNSFKWGE